MLLLLGLSAPPAGQLLYLSHSVRRGQIGQTGSDDPDDSPRPLRLERLPIVDPEVWSPQDEGFEGGLFSA